MKRVFTYILFIIFPFITSGQSLDPLVLEAENLFQKTTSKIDFPSNENGVIRFNSAANFPSSNDVNQLEIDLKKLEIKQFKQDIGLGIRAGAIYNFRENFNEETFTNVVGNASLGIEWNLLKSGLQQNKIRAEKTHNEMIALQLNSGTSKNYLWRRQFRININYVLNIETVEMFENHLNFENEYFDFLNKLYVEKLIKREELLSVSNQIISLNNQITHYKNQNRILKDSVSKDFLTHKALPFPQLDLTKIQVYDRSTSTDLKIKNIALGHHYSNDYSLTLFATQNYTYSKYRQVFYPLVGIRFRAPLRFNQKSKIIETKSRIVQAQERDKSIGTYNQIITQTNSYTEKLRDLQNQYKAWEIINERIRVLSILKTELNSTQSGYRLLQLIEQQFELLENCMQLKRQLYVLISQLQTYNNEEILWSPVIFNKPTTQEMFVLEMNDLYTIDFQIKYIKAKNIKNITINDPNLETKLIQANISFSKYDNANNRTIAQLIEEELITLKN